MRALTEMDNETEARRLGDYLYAQGIPNDVDEDEGEWTIWIHDDEQLAAAEAELKPFCTNPSDSKYTKTSGTADRLRKEQAEEDKVAAKRQVDVRTQVFGQPTGAKPMLTLFMIGLCVIIHLLKISGRDLSPLYYSNISLTNAAKQSMSDAEQMQYRMKRVLPPEVTGQRIGLAGNEKPQRVGVGEAWRLITPIFMHGGFLHIIFNMYWLYFLGGVMEGKLGFGRFLGFVILAALLSNIGQYIAEGPYFLGMSGVNYGLFGYLWIRGKLDPTFGFQLDPSTIAIMLIWFGVCLIGLMPNVANTAHALGLIVGCAAAWIATQRALR